MSGAGGPTARARRSGQLLVGTLVAAALAGCASGGAAGVPAPEPPTLTVGAASSLTEVFAGIAEEFTESTGIPVRLAFAGSSAVAEQIRGGAPIDVFASAGAAAMAPLVAERLVTDVTDFATNSLTIAVPRGNPGGVTGLTDLPRVSVVVCAVQVPCGTATAALFERNSIDARPVSNEPDARSVLMKIRTDEADAGVVYVTDVVAAGDEVDDVTVLPTANVSTTYQAAVVVESQRTASAAAFVRFLAEPKAQAALAQAGFGPPP